MKKSLVVLSLSIILVLSLVFVSAVANSSNSTKHINSTNVTERIKLMEEQRANRSNLTLNRSGLPILKGQLKANLTDFGQCINDVAKMKNECFASAKNSTTLCEVQKNRTGNETKDCNEEVKLKTSQCKVDFQKAKREQCGQIKHNIIQGFFAWFK